jgi:predicted helicase
MMAPYAIAHMKIGLKLAETGYTFPEDGPRVNVYLTNALEPAHAINPGLEFEAPMLAHEAAAANRVKEQLAATVVVGNPPYSLVSANMEPSQRLLVDRYKYIEDQRLRERGALQLEKILNDDYVKFIAKSQDYLNFTNAGVLGLITNHAYLDNPTMRGLRHNLISNFEQLHLYDLGGSTKKSDGDLDENVFDIQQGVGIFLGTKWVDAMRLQRHAAISGAREVKYSKLSESTPRDVIWTTLAPAAPHFLFVPTNYSLQSEYDKFVSLNDIFAVHSIGFFTSKDHFVISRDPSEVIANAKAFRNSRLPDDELCKSLEINAKDAWNVERSRKHIQELSDGEIATLTRKFTHRPFDEKYIFFHKSLVWSMADPVNKNLLFPGNISLVTSRQLAAGPWNHIFCSSGIVEMFLMSNKTKEGNHVFPLYLSSGANSKANLDGDERKITNISKIFLRQVSDSIDSAGVLSPKDVFHFIYAVLHSSAYRDRYSEFIKIDFPRIPIPGSRKVFDALAKLGAELVAWHLMEHPDAINIVAGSARNTGSTAWFGTDYSLSKVAEKSRELADVKGIDDKVGKVFVNATSGFANVRQSIWNRTIGVYQVLHKWLDDRRKAGRSLSQDDITHWLRVYAALQATQKLMLQVDTAIEANGGWPGAFSQNHPPPDAATLAAEQMVQKEQLKAQKKATTAAKKRASYASSTGATSLFD